MNENSRIQQFKQMAAADPENELGHFSLGKAYLDSGRFTDAVTPLLRVVELKPDLSKAYQLLGEAYEKAGQRDKSIEILTRGVTVADEQGDLMPRDAMVKMLKEWSAPVPAFKERAGARSQSHTSDGEVAGSVSPPGFQCSRCSRPGGQLEKQPFKGPLGEKILTNVCLSCWREWIAMGTKVINELGLVLSSPAGQEAYDQYMIEFLQLEDK